MIRAQLVATAAAATAAVALTVGTPSPASVAGAAYVRHAQHAHRGPGASTPATAAPGPQLSIAITDGRTSTSEGDRLTYTITIRNLGSSAAKALQVSQTLPTGLSFVSTDHRGKAGGGRVAWTVDLAAGGESTLATVARVGRTPDALLRLATVACAAVTGDAKPVVCSTHSDLLPAGAARPAPTGSHPRWYGAGAVALVGGVLVAMLMRRRKRRSSPVAPAAGAVADD
jgi:uncharacterized repeat protein (TIGR01451 family)